MNPRDSFESQIETKFKADERPGVELCVRITLVPQLAHTTVKRYLFLPSFFLPSKQRAGAMADVIAVRTRNGHQGDISGHQ